MTPRNRATFSGGSRVDNFQIERIYRSAIQNGCKSTDNDKLDASSVECARHEVARWH
jgi:hypothetical protein